jgi:hypothetical protein
MVGLNRIGDNLLVSVSGVEITCGSTCGLSISGSESESESESFIRSGGSSNGVIMLVNAKRGGESIIEL